MPNSLKIRNRAKPLQRFAELSRFAPTLAAVRTPESPRLEFAIDPQNYVNTSERPKRRRIFTT